MTGISVQAAIDEVPPTLRSATTCMLKALKSTPGVDHPRLGFSKNNGKSSPFLEYDASEKAHWTTPTHFDLLGTDKIGRPFFQAVLPGVHAENEDLDLHVTNAVIEKWEKQCDVSALYVTF